MKRTLNQIWQERETIYKAQYAKALCMTYDDMVGYYGPEPSMKERLSRKKPWVIMWVLYRGINEMPDSTKS